MRKIIVRTIGVLVVVGLLVYITLGILIRTRDFRVDSLLAVKKCGIDICFNTENKNQVCSTGKIKMDIPHAFKAPSSASKHGTIIFRCGIEDNEENTFEEI